MGHFISGTGGFLIVIIGILLLVRFFESLGFVRSEELKKYYKIALFSGSIGIIYYFIIFLANYVLKTEFNFFQFSEYLFTHDLDKLISNINPFNFTELSSMGLGPLFPLVVKLLGTLLFKQYHLVSIFVSIFFAVIFYIFLHKLTKQLTDSKTADKTLVISLLLPVSAGLFLPFQLSMFLAFSAMTFYYAMTGKKIFIIYSLLALLTDPKAILLLIPLMFYIKGRERWFLVSLNSVVFLLQVFALDLWKATAPGFHLFYAFDNTAAENLYSRPHLIITVIVFVFFFIMSVEHNLSQHWYIYSISVLVLPFVVPFFGNRPHDLMSAFPLLILAAKSADTDLKKLGLLFILTVTTGMYLVTSVQHGIAI